MRKLKRRMSSSQMIILGFACFILAGTILLMLPVSSKTGTVTPFIDCLLTATSAVCVTGLVVYDTAMHWTVFGQAVILILIQIGGMGIVTVAVSISLAAGRRISLWQRNTMKDSVSAPQVGGIVRFTGFILRSIILFELLGAALLAPVFIRDYGTAKGIWMSVFHSISAFCNAGFDIVDDGIKFNSLIGYSVNPVINVTIMLLIIIGGLGFWTWRDIYNNGIHFRRYRMQTKVILSATACLLFLPAAYYFFLELNTLPFKERIWGSLFQAVTPRTAGFSTVDPNAISESGQMLTSLLMIIGGAPGSTAGGMKVTTFAVMLSAAAAVFQRRKHGQFFGRRIDDQTIKNAATVFMMYVTLFLMGGIAVSRIENLPIMACLFESASAVGTVGLTLGITPTLGSASKLIITVLMYVGRVGGLTLIFAVLPAKKDTLAQLPLEQISVG